MSIPRAKTPSSDVMNKTGADAHVIEKSAKPAKKTIPISQPAKSRIPKQGKGSGISVEQAENIGHANIEKDDESKPSTPTRRPFSKTNEKPTAGSKPRATSVIASGLASSQKRILENQFLTKKKRYISLKKDIEDKQKSSESAFEELFQLREKILASGGKDPGKLEELLPPMNTHFCGQSRNAGGSDSLNSGAGERPSGDKDFIVQFEASLRALPESLISFCQEAIEKRANVLGSSAHVEEEADPDNPPILTNFKEEIENQLEVCKLENAEFLERLESVRQEQFRQIHELVQRATCLWRECQVLRQESMSAKASEDQHDKTEEFARELKAEKEKLMKARAKIRDQDTLISNNETKLRQAQDNIKHLETQLKHKEANIEQKNRELNKAMKNNECNIGKLEKQKGVELKDVECRVTKLKEELEFKDNETKIIISEYKKQIEDLKNVLNEEKKTRQELETQFEEFKMRNAKLEEKCKQLLEVQDKRKDLISDEQHTEYEIQLFNDLKETQDILAEKEEIIHKLQIEREEIIAAVNEAGQENDSSKQRLTAELIKKSNELQSLKNQFTQLQKNYKRLQQKTEHLEHKLSEVNRVQMQMKDGSRANYGLQIMQLQQQVTDLRSSLAEANMQNSELEKSYTQLQLKLEHYKRYMRNQDRDIKVRREMQQLLQLKDADEDGESVEQSNHHSVNAEDFQQLYSTLENKELQLMKLEKLVKQMEKQEESSQAQRTRLENRIATLELELKEGQQAHRNRGFSFL